MSIKTDWSALHGDAFKKVPVLVTGGCGFIGSHLVEALAALGAEVRVLDNLTSGKVDNLPKTGNVKHIHESIMNPAALEKAVAGCRYVFHLGAMVSVPQSVSDPVGYHDVNATGSLYVLEAARKANVQRLMYSASSSAYGDSEVLPKIETMADLPMSPYAAGKLVGEHYVRAYASCYEIDAVSLRYFNIFGPRQNPHSPYSGVIAAFSKMILAGQAPRITGDGTATRDFTYVHNVVHANLLGARASKRLNGDMVNVAIGKRVSVMQLAQQMCEMMGRGDLKPTLAPPRPGDVMHSLADLTKARATLGYQPIVDFEPGLKETCDWYRASL